MIQVRPVLSEIFLGRTTEYPKAIRPIIQKLKTSMEVPRDTSHFGESLERTAPTFEATRFWMSIWSGGFIYKSRIPNRAAISPGIREWVMTPKEVLKSSPALDVALKMPMKIAERITDTSGTPIMTPT